MTIIYVHGVNTRETEMSAQTTAMLRRHVAPLLADNAADVPIEYAYWGDVAARFAWDGASRPRTPIAGMGADEIGEVTRMTLSASLPDVFRGVPQAPAGAPSTGGLAAAGPAAAATVASPVRLKDLTAEGLADLLAAVFTADVPDGAAESALLVLDDAAREPDLQTALAAARNLDEEWAIVAAAVRARLEAQTGVAGMGFDWLNEFGSRLKEALDRSASAPSYLLGRAVAEFRKPLNELISVFLGDVFEYLKERGSAADPGPIQRRFLEPLTRAHERKSHTGEPIVVLSHSMGGQVVYDAVTHFLPAHAERRSIRIDFWCATASQVGLFEELKLFVSARDDVGKPDKVAFPATNLGYWWNVWDHNDFISYTGERIFDGVDDESYDSGMGLMGAHGGYLQRPSFYRKLAAKIGQAIGDAQ